MILAGDAPMQEKLQQMEEVKSDGRVRSGKARMSQLTQEERSVLARKAARSRWHAFEDTSLVAATHMGAIKIGGGDLLPCAVLEDGTRVLTQFGFLSAIGRKGGPKNTIVSTDGGVDKVAPFLQAENLKPYVSEELRASCAPVAFRMTTGAKAWGYRADLLPKVCEVYLKARDNKATLKSQEATVFACDILVRGLAQIGIIALIDEATGYQRDRATDALVQILEAFIAKELQPWVKTFPSDYYQQLFRLRGLTYPADKVQRPQYFGVLTNDIVYRRIAPGVLQELKKAIPRNEAGRPTAKYFQKLTSNIGYPKLREHLGAVVAVMKLSADYQDFIRKLDSIHPRYGQQMLLPYEPDTDTGRGI